MGWYEATNAHFRRDYYTSNESCTYNTVLLDGWEGLKAYTFKKNCRHVTCDENFSAMLRVEQHGLYTSNLHPTPMNIP